VISDKLLHFEQDDPPSRQAKARAQIDQQVAEYLARGGKIEQVEQGRSQDWEYYTRYIREMSYNRMRDKNGTGNTVLRANEEPAGAGSTTGLGLDSPEHGNHD
jgi:predicted TIM-barrel fold metal-dependent hydrolase